MLGGRPIEMAVLSKPNNVWVASASANDWHDNVAAAFDNLLMQVIGVVPLSAIVAAAANPLMSSCARVISFSCPGPPISLIGLPKASPAAWIFVLKPRRERPRPWAKAFSQCVE